MLIVSFSIFLISSNKNGLSNAPSIEMQDGKDDIDKIDICPKPANSDVFLEPLFSNITNIVYYQGVNQTGDLDSLKYVDDDKFLIAPTLDSGKYKFDISFQFELDLDTYPLAYYDLYLFLDIDAPLFENELVYFQGNQSYDWKNITTINTNATHLKYIFMEKCIEFRIYAQIDKIKLISIDRIRFMLAHNGMFDPFFYIGNDNYAVSSRDDEVFSEDPNWWVSFPDNDWIYQKDTLDDPAKTEIQIIMYLESDNVVRVVECSDLSIYFNWTSSSSNPGILVCNTYIFNYGTKIWDPAETHVNVNQFYAVNWTSDVNNNIHNYIIDLRWAFKIFSIVDGTPDETEIYLHNCTANIKALHDFNYYPDVNLSSSPSTPIASLGEFNITANVGANGSSTINSVKYCMFSESWSSGWNDMDFFAGDEYYKELDTADLDITNYTVLVNATDSSGLSTYEFLDIELNNTRPEIQFVDLDSEINPVNKLNNYELQVLVNDLEDDSYENVSIMLYNKTNHAQFAEWQDMNPSGTSGSYNFVFDPIDFSGGIYTLTVRAADAKGYGYNSTKIIMPTEVKDTRLIADDDDDDDDLRDQITLLSWGIVGLGILSAASIFANITYVFLRKKGRLEDLKNKILKRKRKEN